MCLHCSDEDNSLTRGLAGSIALDGHHGRRIHDCWVILIRYRGCGALVLEGPSLVLLASVVRVLYPGYRRTPIMTQPRNPVRDMLGLPVAMPGGFQYQEHKYPDGQHSIEYPSLGASHLVESCHCPLQRWDKTVPGRTDSKNRSGQIKPTPVDVSYAAPQAHAIINVVVHREYSPGIIFIFS
jgi:hypothetical protein